MGPGVCVSLSGPGVCPLTLELTGSRDTNSIIRIITVVIATRVCIEAFPLIFVLL